MFIEAVSANGLADALNRCQPVTVHRSFNGKNVGDVEVLLTPKDIAGRRLGALWHFGRPKFSLGLAHELPGQQLAYGLAAGNVSFPDKCAVCLGEPSQAAVWEMHAELLKGGSGRYQGNRRTVVAANQQRVWYSVPFCTAHAAKPGAVALGLTMFNRGWIAFRNNEYASEFGDINNIAPRHFVRRWWAALALLAAMLLFMGGGITASVWGEDSAADDLAFAAILLVLGAGLLAYLYRVLVAPWNSRRKAGEAPPSDPSAIGRHQDGGRRLGVVVILVLVGCSSTGTGSEETTTTGPAPPVTAVTTTTSAPTTTTTSEPTTTSTTIAATTTVGTIDPDAAQTDIAEAGDRWIASHDVILDHVQLFNEVNLAVATEHNSIWAPIFDTDEGNIYALYATLAICALADEGTSPETILDTILAGSTVVTDNPDELLFFTGLAVSGASNVFCPEHSDTVRQVVP